MREELLQNALLYEIGCREWQFANTADSWVSLLNVQTLKQTGSTSDEWDDRR